MHPWLLICALLAPGANNDVDPKPLNTVTVGLGENFSVEYERAVHPQMSLFVGPALFAGYTSLAGDERSELGVGGHMGARFFVTGEAPEGLFISPSITLSYARLLADGESSSGLRLASGAMLGYTWLFGNAFDLSLGAGANYIGLTNAKGSVQMPGPVEATIRVALGVAF